MPPSSSSPSTHHKPFFSNSSPSPTSVSSAVKQDKADDVNSPRRLTRQRKLRHLSEQDLGFYVLPEKSRSSPTSPEYSSRKSCSPVGDPSRRKSCNSFVGPQGQVPQPLPLPESSMMNRRPDSAVKDVYFFGPTSGRKSIDQVPTTSASSSPSVKSSSNCNGNNWGCNYKLGLNVQSRKGSAPVTTISSSSHPIISPRRSNTVDIFPSHSSRVAANGSSNHFTWEMGMGMSQDVNFEQASCNLSRSAPTSVFSSPAVSPRRANKGDPFPCLVDHQYYHQDAAAAAFPSFLSPKTPTLSPSHSPLHSPTPRSPRFNHIASNAFDSNSLPTAHPLPLPPGAVAPVQPQPMTMHQNVAPPPPSLTMHQTVAPTLSASSMKGQWQKGKLIGRGTFGSVYVATNRETGALCAMKEVDVIPDDPKSAESIKQLEQEIKVLRTLKHPNIVQYLGSEMIDDHFYIYLEYVYPGSINKYVRDHIGAMTESVVRNFTRHILSGLAFLHDKKTIHRDIKGANLLVDASGVVKLADFGMAKLLSAQSYDLSMKGSPYWMAPELIKAVIQNDADPNLALAVDIWSLGCTIIEMYNGKPPWSEFEGPQAMFKVLHRTPDIPENLSAEGKEFLSLCFRRNPAERPSAKKLLDHPFVRISNDKNVSSYHRAFSLAKIMDKLQSPKDRMKHNKVGRGG